MNLEELNELDFSNIGDWPVFVKAILVLILCALVAVGFTLFLYRAEDAWDAVKLSMSTVSRRRRSK